MEKTKLMVMFVFSLFLVGVFAVGVEATDCWDCGHPSNLECHKRCYSYMPHSWSGASTSSDKGLSAASSGGLPEFTTLGVGLASIGGLAGYSLYRRKKQI
jgi:hypothetical protein